MIHRNYPTPYTPQEVQAVWEKGKKPSFFWAFFYSAKDWRVDACGSWICRSDYKDKKSPYGWVVDNIRPKTRGGSDAMNNLQPLQWRNNLHKKEKYL